MIEILKNIIGYANNLVVLVTVILSLWILFNIRHLEKSKVKNFMIMFAIGTILWDFGEAAYIITDGAFPSWPDVFYVPGSLLLIVALTYLYSKLENKQLTTKEKLMFSLDIVLVTSIIGYLFYTLIVPYTSEYSSLENILNFFYPITSTILFLITNLYRAHDVKKRGYLFYIMSSFFFMFIGDILFTYSTWNERPYGVVELGYDLLYLIGYTMLFFGILIFFLKLRRHVKEIKHSHHMSKTT